MKKFSVYLLILMLIFQSVISGMGGLQVSAQEVESGIIADVDLIDENGQMMDSTANLEYKAARDAVFHLIYKWNVEEEVLEDQKEFTVQIPAEVSVIGVQQGELVDGNQTVIGSYIASPEGQLMFNFRALAENAVQANGSVSLQASFNSSVQPDADSLVIPFVYAGGSKNVQVNFLEPVGEVIVPEEESAAPAAEPDSEPAEEAAVPAEEESTEPQEEAAKEIVEEEKVDNQAMTAEAVEISENILTGFELTLRDGSPLPNPLPNPIEEEVELKAKYSFALPNDHSYGAGSTYTFQLPEQLEVYNEVKGNLDTYGTYKISTNGTVVFTFNENIEQYSDITGWVEVYSVIDRKLEGGTTQVITVPVKGDVVKEVVLKFAPKAGKSISKKGAPNKSYNASGITWEIDFNKDQSVLENALLSDPLADNNQKFVAGSIKIYELDVQLNGEVIQGKEVTRFDTGSFPINFSTIEGQAYRVIFETEITDGEATTYPNTATLKSDLGTVDASATVATSRGKALEKKSTGYDSKTQTITWEVKYNYNEKSISQNDAILKDEFSKNQVLIDGSIEVLEISINPDTGAESGNSKFTNYDLIKNGTTGFDLQFNQSIDKAYKIIYKTKADARVYENGNVSNKITANGKTVTANQNVTQQVFNKAHIGPVNYKDKKTQWKIRFNSDAHVMNNTVLKDKLPKGLKLESYTITHGGTALKAGTDYNHSYNEATGDILFDFTGLNPVTKEVVVQYVTQFDYNYTENKTAYTNKAELTWVAENETTTRTAKSEATFTPNDLTKLNGSKSGSHNAQTREITWTIGVNYNYREIDKTIVEDIIQGDQNLKLDTLEVFKMNVNPGGGWTKGEKLAPADYSVESIESEGAPGFRVDLGSIDSPYVIEFKTDLIGELVTNRYDNKAVLKDGEAEFPLGASVSIANGGNYTSKDAVQNKQNEEMMDWSVKINATQSTIEDATLTDVPSANQLIMKDSFVLYGTTVNPNGSFSKNTNEILEKDADYSLVFKKDETGKEFFELKFNKTIERPYILEYNTFLMASHGEKVSNSASLKGGKITTENTGSNKEHIVRYSAGDGGAGGKIGQLTVTKIDAAQKEPLSGAEFTLFDKSGKIELYKGETGQDGLLVFDRLKFGDYVLKETKVPAGYVNLDTKGKKITINREVKAPQDAGNSETVLNHPIVYAVNLTKVDSGNSNLKLQGAIFDLQKEEQGKFVTVRENLGTNEQGNISVDGLEPGSYQFLEKASPEGYLLSKEAVPFTLKDEAIKVIEVTAANKAIDLIEVKGTKKWKDADASQRPQTIKIDLLQNGEVIKTAEVSAEDEWKFSFTDLLKTDSLGNDYQYTVKEQPVAGYASITEGFDITNLRSEKMAIGGVKTWLDDNSVDRPKSITVHLLQNGEKAASQEVSLETGWTYQFTGLEKFDTDGEPYSYTIEEQNVEGYESSIDGFNLTNLRTGKTEVEGTKTWLDDNAENRPESITVYLLQNGKEITSQKVSAETDWQYSFQDLETYDENGKIYQYNVKEEAVAGYKTLIEGQDITNLRVGKTVIEGTKTWKDDEVKDRPESIKVNLLQNGIVIDTQMATAEDNWTYAFEKLEKYDEKGMLYQYSIKEHGVPGYKTIVDGYDLTNVRSDQTSISITKGWLDDNSSDRPTAVTMNLHQNGKVFKTVEVTAEDSWMYEFENLEMFDENGKAYLYTVSEEAVKGYESIVNGYDVTNLRVGETSVEGTKTWLDGESKNRPEKITVYLLQNGKVIESKEVTEKDGWTYAFKELEKYDLKGKSFNYTIQESTVAGYTSAINGYDITNLRTGKTKAEGVKTWLDDNSKERPESIAVKLFRNGKVIDSKVVSAVADWKFKFENLEKYDAEGKAYSYSIEEVPVAGYETTVNGFDLVNLRVGETSVEGTKTWLDDNSANRPETITVNLLQNGKVIGSKKVSAAADWKFKFENLEKYDAEGKEYSYSIEEVPVAGYETTVNGFDLVNLRVGETSVEGTKTWLDDDYKNRPDSITVNLLQNGEMIDSIKVSNETGWTFSFTGLDQFDLQGKLFEYAVEEEAVEGYATTIEGYDILNTLLYGKMVLTKVDREDSSRVLEGAVFQLKTSEGKIVKERLVTGKDGTFTVDGLQPGDYQLVELEAPSGYELESAPIQFTIELGQEAPILLTAENTKTKEIIPVIPTVPGTVIPTVPGTVIPTVPGTVTPGPVTGGSPHTDEKKDAEKEKGNKLPDTATSMFNYGLLGLLFLVLGLLTVRRKRA